MKQFFEIVDVLARELLDSQGKPTVEVEVTLDDGTVGRADVSSNLVRKISDVKDLRDNDSDRYRGFGVEIAVENVNGEISEGLLGLNILDQVSLDKLLLDIDGTPDQSRLGINSIFGSSVACVRAASEALGQPLYNYLGGCNAKTIPVPLIPVISNVGNDLINEIMLIPVSAKCFKEAIQECAEITYTLQDLLTDKCDNYEDFLKCSEENLKLVIRAIECSGYSIQRDFKLAVKGNAYTFDKTNSTYYFPAYDCYLSSDDMVRLWEALTEKYDIISLEDTMAAEDLSGWRALTKKLGEKVQIVGNCIFSSDQNKIKDGISLQIANAAVIKLGEVCTISQAFDTVSLVERSGWVPIISGLEAETEDTLIADFSVAVNACQIKAGKLSGTESIAKYNQLLRIEDELYDVPVYLGKKAFRQLI